MSKPEKNLEKIIDRIIDLEPFEDRMIKKIKLEKPEEEAGKIRSRLDELKIMKISTKEELEEIKSELMVLKENERMARFKIEEIKELDRIKRTKIILERLRLGCKMNSKSYY